MKKIILFLTFLTILFCITPGKTIAVPEGIEIDVSGRKVILSGFINTRYFRHPAPYVVVFREGFAAKRSLFIANADPFELIDGLLVLGAIPAFKALEEEGGDSDVESEKVPLEEKSENSDVEKDPLKPSQLYVTVTWEGLETPYKLSDIVQSNPTGLYEFRFQGNAEIAKKITSGDLVCLDSCAVGIISNASIKKGLFEKGIVSFNVRKKLLPSNGTKVKIIFSLEELGQEGESKVNMEVE